MRHWLATLVVLAQLSCQESPAPQPGPATGAGKTDDGSALGNGKKPGEQDGRDDGRDRPNGNNAQQPVIEDPLSIGDVGSDDLPDGPIFEANYQLLVKADIFGGVTVCQGNVGLIVNKDFTFSVPNADLSCVGGLCQIDVKTMLASLQNGNADAGSLASAISADEKFVRIARIGQMSFNPPRPIMLLSPFHFDPIEQAISVNETYQGTVTDASNGVSAQGTINLKVDEANAQRIRWHMSAEGWDGANRALAALLKRIDMTWSLNPLGVPNVTVRALVGDLMKASGQEGQQVNPQELMKYCSGAGGSILGGLAGGLGGQQGQQGGGGILGTIGTIGSQLAQKMDVIAELNLVDQKVLGQRQEQE